MYCVAVEIAAAALSISSSTSGKVLAMGTVSGIVTRLGLLDFGTSMDSALTITGRQIKKTNRKEKNFFITMYLILFDFRR